jgi:hypothetical protein
MAPAKAGRQFFMLDIIMLALGCGSFALLIGYVFLCDKL